MADQDYRSNSDHAEDFDDIDVGLDSKDKKDEKLESTPTKENPLAEINQESIPLRRDPEEEFFMLSVLALKMTHTEEYDAEYIYEISAQKLFLQVKSLRIPFHKWYTWLETRFNQLQQVHQKEKEI